VAVTAHADIFYRTWNKVPERQRVLHYCIDVPASATLDQIISTARKLGVGRGTHQTGIFEVQTDQGIYSRADGCRLDVSTPGRAAKVIFKSWEQLEVEEGAGS
jgi:hypothetical protein